MVVSAEDPFHNVDTSFNGNVTIALPGNPALTTTIQARNGVATFGGLSITTVGQFGGIEVTSAKLVGVTSIPFSVTPLQGSDSSGPAPMIENEEIVTTQKPKKDRKVGKPLFGGFRFQFNMPVNISGATFNVYSTLTKRGKKTITKQKPVSFTRSYNPSTNSVTLIVKNTKPFAKAGGEITITGVTSQAGVAQSPGELEFVVTKNAKAIMET